MAAATAEATAHKGPPLRRIYMDTSAYLCLILAEKGSDAIVKETSGTALLSSVLLVLESRRNVIRLAREGRLSSDDFRACLERIGDDVEQFALRDLTLDLCTSGTMPLVSTPRSLDLVHLLTALWFHSEQKIDLFLTIDNAQAAAAKELGLPVS